MTAPIDLPCTACAATAGNYCTSATTNPTIRMRVTFHHAERVDAAARETTRCLRSDPTRLREALREALNAWEGWASERSPGLKQTRIHELRKEFDL